MKREIAFAEIRPNQLLYMFLGDTKTSSKKTPISSLKIFKCPVKMLTVDI